MMASSPTWPCWSLGGLARTALSRKAVNKPLNLRQRIVGPEVFGSHHHKATLMPKPEARIPDIT
jgi:hypothetical protein